MDCCCVVLSCAERLAVEERLGGSTNWTVDVGKV